MQKLNMKSNAIICGVAIGLLRQVGLAGPPVILSLPTNGALAWTSRYTAGIAIIEKSSGLQPPSWSPFFYDLATNNVRVTQLPGLPAGTGFYRLAIQTNVPDPSLVMRLTFDNDFSNGMVLDVSGHNNHGVRYSVTNWPSVTTGPDGSQAAYYRKPDLVLQGTEYHTYGDYLAVTNWNGIDFLTNGTISVWAWFDTNSYASTLLLGAGYNVPSAGDGNAATYSWDFGREYTENVRFYINMPSSTVAKVYFPDDTVWGTGGLSTYATTNWNMYTVTWNAASNQIIGYYDGQPIGTNTLDAPFLRIYSPHHWMGVGCSHHEGTPQMDYGLPGGDMYPNNGWMGGKLDDIRIYNRALSASEVSTIYTAVSH
jgi:hypothetical protein